MHFVTIYWTSWEEENTYHFTSEVELAFFMYGIAECAAKTGAEYLILHDSREVKPKP